MNTKPTDQDVLSGRGKPFANHPGCVIFRDTCGLFYDAYHDSNNNNDKKKISNTVKLIFEFAGTRFLKKKETKVAKEIKKAAKKSSKGETKKKTALTDHDEWQMLEDSEISRKIEQRFTMNKFQKKNIQSENNNSKKRSATFRLKPPPIYYPPPKPMKRSLVLEPLPTAARKKSKPNAVQDSPSSQHLPGQEFELCLGIIIKEILELAKENLNADHQQLAREFARKSNNKKETSTLYEAVSAIIKHQENCLAMIKYQGSLVGSSSSLPPPPEDDQDTKPPALEEPPSKNNLLPRDLVRQASGNSIDFLVDLFRHDTDLVRQAARESTMLPAPPVGQLTIPSQPAAAFPTPSWKPISIDSPSGQRFSESEINFLAQLSSGMRSSSSDSPSNPNRRDLQSYFLTSSSSGSTLNAAAAFPNNTTSRSMRLSSDSAMRILAIHHQQQQGRRSQDIAHGAKKKLCSIDGCTKQAILGGGMCKKHHDHHNQAPSDKRNQPPPVDDSMAQCVPIESEPVEREVHPIKTSNRPKNNKTRGRTPTRGLSIFQEMSADTVGNLLLSNPEDPSNEPDTENQRRVYGMY